MVRPEIKLSGRYSAGKLMAPLPQPGKRYGAVAVGPVCLLAAPFVWRCPSNLAITPFPHPPDRKFHDPLDSTISRLPQVQGRCGLRSVKLGLPPSGDPDCRRDDAHMDKSVENFYNFAG